MMLFDSWLNGLLISHLCMSRVLSIYFLLYVRVRVAKQCSSKKEKGNLLLFCQIHPLASPSPNSPVVYSGEYSRHSPRGEVAIFTSLFNTTLLFCSGCSRSVVSMTSPPNASVGAFSFWRISVPQHVTSCSEFPHKLEKRRIRLSFAVGAFVFGFLPVWYNSVPQCGRPRLDDATAAKTDCTARRGERREEGASANCMHFCRPTSRVHPPWLSDSARRDATQVRVRAWPRQRSRCENACPHVPPQSP